MNAALHCAGPVPQHTAAASNREEITLKPSKGFPRQLIVEWTARRVCITLYATSKHQWLASVYASEISLLSQPHVFDANQTVYSLNAVGNDASFNISAKDFEALCAKLEPRGVKIYRFEAEKS